MKSKAIVWTFFLLLTIILSACVPTSFSPPTEIHITDGDRVEQAVVAVDGNGRSHIAGVVDDRIVYYRTRYGSAGPLDKFSHTHPEAVPARILSNRHIFPDRRAVQPRPNTNCRC